MAFPAVRSARSRFPALEQERKRKRKRHVIRFPFTPSAQPTENRLRVLVKENKRGKAMKGIMIRVFLVFVFFITAGAAFIDGIWDARPVQAATGYSSFTVNVTSSAHDSYAYVSSAGYFPDIAWSKNSGSTSACTCYTSCMPTGDKWNVAHGKMMFDVNGYLPDEESIVAITMSVYITGKSDTFGGGASYFLCKDDGSGFNAFHDGTKRGRISSVAGYSSLPASGWYTFTIQDPYYNDYRYIYDDSDGLICFDFMDHYQYYGYAPGEWDASKTKTVTLGDYGVNPSQGAQLTFYYADPAIDRDVVIVVNSANYTGGLSGSENVTGVSWFSPRAAWSDEPLCFAIEGDPGAVFDLASLVTASGETLATVSGDIKVDGDYNWNVDINPDVNDWVRVVVDEWAVTSAWGRVEPAPSTTMRNLEIYTNDTVFPQYDEDFKSYIVYKDGLFWVYWKTNMEYTDFDLYELRLYAHGDLDEVLYSVNMTALTSDIYNTDYAGNEFLSAYRYLPFMPFSTEAGYNFRSGLIQDVGIDYVSYATGFWQPVIAAVSDNTNLTYTHSAPFYLNSEEQGVYISLDHGTYKNGATAEALVQVGNHSKVAEYLSYVLVSVIDSSGVVVSSGNSFVTEGENTIGFVVPDEEGSYQVRFTFYDDDNVNDYSYVHDVPFNVASSGSVSGSGDVPGVDDWTDWVSTLLADNNLDNTGGHWLVIFILMALVMIFFRHLPLAATIMVIIIFVGALLLGWLDPWVIVLFCIGGGWWLFSFLKGIGKIPYFSRRDGSGDDDV